MLEPVTVWMVELRTKPPARDAEGVLALDDDALTFRSSTTGRELRIPYAEARSAKRLRGSPVLIVRWRDADRDDDRARTTAFYFAPPPPLAPIVDRDPGPRGGIPGAFGGRTPSVRRQRRQNAGYLTMRSRPLKPTLVAWLSEVRIRIAAGSG